MRGDLTTYRPTDLPTIPTYRPTDLPTYRPTDLPTYLPTYHELTTDRSDVRALRVSQRKLYQESPICRHKPSGTAVANPPVTLEPKKLRSASPLLCADTLALPWLADLTRIGQNDLMGLIYGGIYAVHRCPRQQAREPASQPAAWSTEQESQRGENSRASCLARN